MKKSFIFVLAIFGIALFTTGCGKSTCKNTNPIFDKYTPESKQYKDELVNQLSKENNTECTYWVDKYLEIDNIQFLQVNVQAEDLCAKIVLKIMDSDKGIEDLLKKKGESYVGAELENLKFNIKQDSTSTEFIFQDVTGIKD